MQNKRSRVSLSLRYWLIFLGLVLILIFLAVPTLAAPALQLTPFPTPTPGTDGRILYTVQEGDTLLRISLISGVPIDELRGLNNLTGDTILVGDVLLLGLGGPSQASPTPGPSPTPTEVVPTPSPQPGTGELCILLFEDINGDSIRQEEEPSIQGGAISIGNRSGTVSLTTDTKSGLEPECFEELPEGDYTITVAVPEGYNQTTASSYILKLQAGDTSYVNFGAQLNSAAEAEAPIAASEGGRSPLFAIIGGIFLLAGLGLAIFANRLLRGKA